jgi:Hsp90 protein
VRKGLSDNFSNLQVITALHGLIEADKSSEQAKEIIDLMYHTALLTSGFDVDSPKQYANQVYGMMGMALSSGASPAQANEEQAPSGKDTGTSTVEADQVIEEK